MNKLKDLFYTFACVITCVVFATAIFTTIFWPNGGMGPETLWQIIFVSFLCSLGKLLYPEKEKSKGWSGWYYLLHYLAVNIIVLGCGIWFEWFYLENITMVIGMLVLIALTFLLVATIVWKRTAYLAAIMNERLKEYQKQEED